MNRCWSDDTETANQLFDATPQNAKDQSLGESHRYPTLTYHHRHQRKLKQFTLLKRCRVGES